MDINFLGDSHWKKRIVIGGLVESIMFFHLGFLAGAAADVILLYMVFEKTRKDRLERELNKMEAAHELKKEHYENVTRLQREMISIKQELSGQLIFIQILRTDIALIIVIIFIIHAAFAVCRCFSASHLIPPPVLLTPDIRKKQEVLRH